MNLYIHIPFCKSKCAYCAFLSHIDIGLEDEYMELVCNEIANSKYLDTEKIIDTIYFGGGTPSLVKSSSIQKIIEKIKESVAFSDNVEITIECNPEDITISKLSKWKEAGVNRISVGVQSFSNEVRHNMGRRLNYDEIIERLCLALRVIDNVGVDFISGLPDDICAFSETQIGSLIDIGIKHVSLYDLDVDCDSAIGKNLNNYLLNDDEEQSSNLIKYWAIFKKHGFDHYEVSNFSLNNNHCRHNLDFWHGNDYLGFGLGATSRVGLMLQTNTAEYSGYKHCEHIRITKLSQNECDLLNLSLLLRLNNPVPNKYLAKNPEAVERLIKLKLLDKNHKVTEKGMLYNNQLITWFAKSD